MNIFQTLEEDNLSQNIDNMNLDSNNIVTTKDVVQRSLEWNCEGKAVTITGMKQVIVEKKMLTIVEVYEVYERECNKLNHQLLEKRLTDMQNVNTNLDLYVFGKLKIEIKEAIEAYQIKELYITREKQEKLKTFIEDDSCFNFKIILIESLEEGDIAYRFSKDYNGVMGIKYF